MNKVLGHTESHRWLGRMLCACPGQASGGQGFPQAKLDVTMQGLFYQTSAAVFRSNGFLNSLLGCTMPTIMQKTFGEV